MFPHTVPVRFWNDLLYSMTLASVLVMTFLGEASTNWGYMMAASIVAAIPVTVIFVFLQRCFIHGFHRRCGERIRQTFPALSLLIAPSALLLPRSVSGWGAQNRSLYTFLFLLIFGQTAETPYVRCFRCLCIHLPRLPVLDGSSCPGSRFTAHTPRLPTSIFVHCNIKTLYYSLLGYHTNNI